MLYTLGEKVPPRFRRIKALSLASFICLITVIGGGVLTSYQKNVANVHFSPADKHSITTSIGKPKKQKAKTPTPTKAQLARATTPRAGSVPEAQSAIEASSLLRISSCTSLFPSATANLTNAVTPELRKLAQYEQLCNGDPVDRSTLFAPTPTTTAAAASDASDMASRLQDYANFGVKPLVIFEPDDDNGNNLDLAQYAAGAYDTALSAYFADLVADGITDSTIGTWVVIPEGNIPVWTSTDPSIFSTDVVKTVNFERQYFPTAQDSILLDSETYPSASSWSNGSYTSLLPYVQAIPKGLLNSFGLEGFPWAAPANQAASTLYNPDVYLRVDLAAQAAQALGVSNIWLNTGTFSQMYTENPAETITNTPLQRQTMLDGVVAQAKLLQSQGYSVEVHLFAQDKANTAEAIDWSYWTTPNASDPNTQVFTTFIHDLQSSNIPLWLFDTYDQ
jgi:hypothetical protein